MNKTHLLLIASIGLYGCTADGSGNSQSSSQLKAQTNVESEIIESESGSFQMSSSVSSNSVLGQTQTSEKYTLRNSTIR